MTGKSGQYGMKTKLKKENPEVVSATNQLKLMVPKEMDKVFTLVHFSMIFRSLKYN